MRRCKAAVIGAGASGLMAAATAARILGKGKILVVEGSPKPGRKLLATGNGRCNLTNLSIQPQYYHGDTLPPGLFAHYSSQRIIEEFRQLGLLTQTDPQGRVYPHSLQAAAVVKTLVGACQRAGAELACSFPVKSLQPVRGGWLLTSQSGEEIFAQRCVLACGGQASPKLSTGSGYGLAKELGHTVTPLSPSLVGLAVPGKGTKAIKGMRCKARVSLYSNKRLIKEERGEIIFGDQGISGVCVMNLSAKLREIPRKGISLTLDLLESLSPAQVFGYLKALCQSQPDLPAGELLGGAVNLRVGQALIKNLGLPFAKPISQLAGQELRAAAQAVKAFYLPIAGPLGWEDAQATAGGIPLDQVNLKTMESLQCPGLYITGELLNVDGDCGGYNLHWAWTTGLIAGKAIGESLRTG